MRERYRAVFVLFFMVFMIVSYPMQARANLGETVTIESDRIIVYLRKTFGQEYQVSYTSNPSKFVIDSNRPILDLPASQIPGDVALREIRYSETERGSRLVLDFNYLVPEGVITEGYAFFQLEIPKTYVNASRSSVESGVIYGHQRRADTFGPNVVNYIEIDLRRNLEVKLALSQDRVFGAENVSAIAQRAEAIAAVNGAFFAATGRPLGVLMIDGELISEPYANRTAVGLGPGFAVMDHVDFSGGLWQNGSLLTSISGLNRPRLQDELIVYTRYHGTKTNTNPFGVEVTVIDGVVTGMQTGNSTIPPDGFVLSAHGNKRPFLLDLRVGDPIDVRFDLDPSWDELGVTQIIGGGPRLVENGELRITGQEERFRDDILVGRAPRTAIGITNDQKLLLVTVNGRQPNISVGMTLAELGNLLLELGATQAMNLDGGGSTTMVIRNLVLNLPSTGQERPVSNAIVVVIGSR